MVRLLVPQYAGFIPPTAGPDSDYFQVLRTKMGWSGEARGARG